MTGKLADSRITRLTFRVMSSPFLATQVPRQVAEDYHHDFPCAADVVKEAFYVDDCLIRVSTLEEAMEFRTSLNQLLSTASMTLTKCRSSSAELLSTIPDDLKRFRLCQLQQNVTRHLAYTETLQRTPCTSQLHHQKLSNKMPGGFRYCQDFLCPGMTLSSCHHQS